MAGEGFVGEAVASSGVFSNEEGAKWAGRTLILGVSLREIRNQESHKGQVSAGGRELLLNGRRPDKDFISQTWRGCYRLKEVLQAEVTPLLCFTDAFVEGRLFVRGVKIVPLDWLNDEILKRDVRYESRLITQAVNSLGKTTGSYPSSVPRPRTQK